MKKNNHVKVLQWVNARRKDFNLKPLSALPKGEIDSSGSCPIAKSLFINDALNLEVLSSEISMFYSTQPPKYISKFIDDFDMGKFPELVK